MSSTTRRGTTLGLCVAVAAAGLSLSAAAARSSREQSRSANAARTENEATVRLHPGVVRIGQHTTVTVTGLRAGSLEVRLSGATDILGRQLPWQPLRLVGRTWVALLAAPTLRGLYPVELRTGPGASSFRARHVLLRIFARGTRARPSFTTPAAVASWWVRTVAHAKLVALKAWARPAFDRRDRRLHRLFVVAYSLPGKPRFADRLGMFVTAFRDGYKGRWRLLEATVAP
jgi:hypothetical protein